MAKCTAVSDIERREHDETYGVKKIMPYGSNGASAVSIAVNADGTLSGGFDIPTYDYVSLTQAALTDAWKFYINGSGGTLLATLTITYTDATKATISNVAKT